MPVGKIATLLLNSEDYREKYELTEHWMLEAFTYLSPTSACYEDVIDGSTPMCGECFETLASEVNGPLQTAMKKALRRVENKKRKVIECE